jgi:alkanesulfonate monooxygenase SsuD/methylene tetrahydromethanopterin reductase-like flavin-dependent oxidoreductase (luciferase family)
VRICRALWSADAPVDFAGRYHRLEQVAIAPRPAQDGGPPFWLGGAGPKALARVGRHFDGWMPYIPQPGDMAEAWEQVRAAAVDHHRDPARISRCFYATVAIDDADGARRTLAEYSQAYYGLRLEGMSALQAFYGGDADGCLAWLRTFLDAGAQQLIIRVGDLSFEGSYRRFADDVLPGLRSVG